jgi:acyl carrier protein
MHIASERLSRLNNRDAVVSFLVQEVSAISGVPVGNLSEATPLIGGGTVLNSRGLVELLVALEEFSEEKFHVHFDWTNDSAMSTNRSVYRTVASLADHIATLSPS